jgi:hypothetical protein
MPVKYQTTYSGLIIPGTRSIAQKTVLYQIILAPRFVFSCDSLCSTNSLTLHTQHRIFSTGISRAITKPPTPAKWWTVNLDQISPPISFHPKKTFAAFAIQFAVDFNIKFPPNAHIRKAHKVYRTGPYIGIGDLWIVGNYWDKLAWVQRAERFQFLV